MTLETYYAQRAAEYEKIYHKPERQADLARMRNDIPALFKGARVLEIACGTGYWTPLIAAQAEAVTAIDFNEETLAIARRIAPTTLSVLLLERGEREAARELLAPVYGWFTEVFDTPDLIDARTLLGSLER